MRQSNSLIISSFPSQTSSTSSVVWSQNFVRCSIQVTIGSGTLNGTFVLQGSNDSATGQEPYQFLPSSWSAVGSSSQVVCSATSPGAIFLIPATEVAYEYLRLQYTAGNSGAALGLFSARIKSLGI